MQIRIESADLVQIRIESADFGACTRKQNVSSPFPRNIGIEDRSPATICPFQRSFLRNLGEIDYTFKVIVAGRWPPGEFG